MIGTTAAGVARVVVKSFYCTSTYMLPCVTFDVGNDAGYEAFRVSSALSINRDTFAS